MAAFREWNLKKRRRCDLQTTQRNTWLFVSSTSPRSFDIPSRWFNFTMEHRESREPSIVNVHSYPSPLSPSPLHPSSVSRKFGPDPSKRTWEQAICNDQKPDSRGRPASSERVQGHPKYFYGPVRSMYPRLERAPVPTPGRSSTSTPSASHAHPLPIPSSILQFTSGPFFRHHALRVLKHHVVYERVI